MKEYLNCFPWAFSACCLTNAPYAAATTGSDSPYLQPLFPRARSDLYISGARLTWGAGRHSLATVQGAVSWAGIQQHSPEHLAGSFPPVLLPPLSKMGSPCPCIHGRCSTDLGTCAGLRWISQLPANVGTGQTDWCGATCRDLVPRWLKGLGDRAGLTSTHIAQA